MPRYTEERIKRLCKEAVLVQDQQDVERVLTDFRTALEDHIRLAKESLGGQAANIALLDQQEKKNRAS